MSTPLQGRPPAGTGAKRTRLLRTRLRNTIVVITGVSVLLLGVPLAVAVARVVESEALSALQTDAVRVVAAVPDEVFGGSPVAGLPTLASGAGVGLYGPDGRRLAGVGPARSPLALAAADGTEHSGHENGELAVVTPVLSDAVVTGSVRASRPTSQVLADTVAGWAALLGLTVAVLMVAALLARRSARTLAAPFEQLTAGAQTLGQGEFALTFPHWGIREADMAASALSATARELGHRLEAERDFVKHASHQLRTPLAGLIVALERHPETGTDALERARHLQTTLADLLVVRGGSQLALPCDPVAVAQQVVRGWAARTAREVRLRSVDVERVSVPESAVRQALEVLVDNAVRHGAGAVTVTVEPLGESVIVEVADEGPGLPEGRGPGTGLRLATGLVQRFGGDLLVRRSGPRPRVALLLPQASTSQR